MAALSAPDLSQHPAEIPAKDQFDVRVRVTPANQAVGNIKHALVVIYSIGVHFVIVRERVVAIEIGAASVAAPTPSKRFKDWRRVIMVRHDLIICVDVKRASDFANCFGNLSHAGDC
jgi:hypothetical protein